MFKKLKELFSGGGEKGKARIRTTGGRSGELIGEFKVETYQAGRKIKTETIKRKRHWLPGIGNWGQK